MVRTRLSMLTLLLLAGVTAWGQIKTPPETRNAALRYWQAFAEMKDPPTDVPTRDAIEKAIWGDAAWDEAKLGPIVTENENALGIMQRATKLPECDWGLEYSQGPRASIAFVPKARVLARLNMLRGMREVHVGHMQAAVETWIAGIRFSQDLSKGGSLLFAAVATNALREQMHTLQAAVQQGKFSAAQKKQLSTAIRELPEDGLDWGEAWAMDEVGTDLWFSELRSSPDPGRVYESMMNQAANKNCIPPPTGELRKYREYMAGVTLALRLPPEAAKQRIAELDPKERLICEGLRNAIPNANRLNDGRTQIIATRRSLLEALADK